MGWPVLASALAIFAASYALIFSGYVHRTLAALVGAVTMIVAGSALGFYPYHAAVASIDMDTLWLLFGMMAIVGLLRETGFFQYIAIRAAKIARGNPTILFLSLGAATAIASMFLDNVTTLLTVVPVTISVTEVLGIPAGPRPSSVIRRTSSSGQRRGSRSTRFSPTPCPWPSSFSQSRWHSSSPGSGGWPPPTPGTWRR